MKIKTKDLLTLSELTPKEFLGLIDNSIKIKKELKLLISLQFLMRFSKNLFQNNLKKT